MGEGEGEGWGLKWEGAAEERLRTLRSGWSSWLWARATLDKSKFLCVPPFIEFALATGRRD